MLQMCGILQYLNLLIFRLAGGPTVRAADEYAQKILIKSTTLIWFLPHIEICFW